LRSTGLATFQRLKVLTAAVSEQPELTDVGCHNMAGEAALPTADDQLPHPAHQSVLLV
jgi:hypothetical protein